MPTTSLPYSSYIFYPMSKIVVAMIAKVLSLNYSFIMDTIVFGFPSSLVTHQESNLHKVWLLQVLGKYNASIVFRFGNDTLILHM